jgi:hypothetical protein
LQSIITGLVDNPGMDPYSIVHLSEGLVAESIDQLKMSQFNKYNFKEKKPDPRIRNDEAKFLIAKEPGRSGAPPKSATKTHSYLLVNAGVQLM